jgi:arginase family enzyme
MMRLPTQKTAEGLDVCFVGVPIDIGASNRSGTRHGPRQIRQESCMLRPYNMANLGGCDLVEVSPPLDSSGNTALIAPNFLFKMLCVLPGVQVGA